MNGWKQRVVLVTGATTGIGLALAKLLRDHEFKLVLTARPSSMGRFQEQGFYPDERLMLRSLDVTDPDAADALIEEIDQSWGGVDVLVNNAGILYRAVMEHLEDRHEEMQFHTNYLGPLHLIRKVLPSMRAKRSGHIINLSSVGGMMAMPTMGGYSASKFALEGASEALWYELKPWGIAVTLIEPGFVNSNSFRNAMFTPKSKNAFEDERAVYHPYYVNLIGFITRMMEGSPTTSNGVARIILKTMNQKHPPLRRAGTWDAVFFSLMRRLLPKRLYHFVLYRSLPKISQWVKPPESS